MTVAQQTYLARVLPWPTGDENGYVNIHWTFSPADHKDGTPYPWTGQACRSVDEAVRAIAWAQNRPGTRDIYACQSLQSQAKDTDPRKPSKYLKALRSQANSLALKGLFLDIDLKDYASVQELYQTLSKFVLGSGMPQPNVIVATTGGYHVYWTLDRHLTPTEWSPLAHSLAEATRKLNLKCDVQCTIDASRVLRIPDTLNFKRNQPVKLIGAVNTDYNVDEIERILLPFKVTSAPVTRINAFVSDPALFPARKQDEEDDLSKGIEPPSHPPIGIQDVMVECPFVHDAVSTGGVAYANPLWNLTTLLATFTEEGLGAAHLMGRKHPGYTRESTDALYARKFNERIDKNIGWPSCRAIYGAGSKLCQTCKHFSENKSPLNFALKALAPAPGIAPGIKTTNVLPSGYSRDAKGFINRDVTQDDGTTSKAILCEVIIGDAWLQQDPWSLHFAAEVKPNDIRQVALPFEMVDVQEMRKELSRQGITLHSYQVKSVGEFLMSWIDTLKKTKDAVVNTAPFGWNSRDGKLEGFVYGGKLHTPTGPRIAPNPDAVTSKSYTPVGDIQPWISAAKLITNQKRPALDMILASSFAAPLVIFTNMRGLVMSCVGETGIGKSTSLDIAQAVWGHPARAKNKVSDTDNSVMNIAGELKSLPVYWDDMKLDDSRKYNRILFQSTYGSEKKRLDQRSKQKDFGTWSTIMVSTSNNSLMELATQSSNIDAASLYRLFEVDVPPPILGEGGSPGQIAKTDAARLVGKLDYNFGRVGEAYAEYLGANFLTLEDEVLDYQKVIDEEVSALQPERFWTSIMACICVGAKISNRLGFTEIDEPSLRAFMVTSLGILRKDLQDQAVDMTKEENVSTILGNFLNAKRARNTLITNVIHKGRGKPAAGSIKVLGDASKLEAIHVHIGLEDKVMRLNSTALSEWCKDKDISRQAFTKALEKQYGSKIVHGNIGGGTPYSVSGIVYMLEIDITDFMDNAHVEEIFSDAPSVSPSVKEPYINGEIKAGVAS